MKRFLQSLVVALLPLVMVGCYEDSVGPEEPVVGNLSLSKEYMEVGPEGGEFSVDIFTEYNFQQSSNVDWIEILGGNCGAEYCTLNFSVLPNDTTSAREGVITIFCEDYNLMATLTVVQAAGVGSDTDAWTFKGVGKFRGAAVLDGVFNIDTAVEIEVNVYEHKDNKGVYMIPDPWLATIAYGFGYSSIDEVLADGLISTNADFVIDASNPDAVVIEEQSLGVDLGYGDMLILSGYPNYITDPAAGAGTLVDGYITFPSQSLLFYSPGINAALGKDEKSLLYANTTGMFRVALPGAVPLCDIEIGTAKFSEVFPDLTSQYPDDSAFAYGIWGKEIANVKMLIAETSTVGEYLAQGVTLEQLVAANGEVVGSDVLSQINSEDGYIQGVTGLVSGTEYTLAIYAENVYGKSGFAYTTHTTDGEKPADSVKYPCEISVDLNKMSAYLPGYESTYPDTTALSFAVKGENIKEAMYLLADTATFEYFLAQGATLEELVVANGYAFEEDELAAINGGGYANGFIKLDPGTSYTLAIYAKNVYSESTAISDTHTTEEIDYKGELVIGDYYMSCTMGAGTESETTFENLFTVTPDGESVTDFIVADIGANVGGIKWVAAYDSAAGTLTLSGIDKSRENSGNLFGKPYAYFDQEQTQALMFMSFATADSTGADPLVLKVDPWTKEITGMQNDAFIVAVVDSASGQILQYFGYYEGSATTILHESAAATRVPFSSVNINKHTVSKRLRSMKMAKLATSANSSMKPATNSVKKVSLERSKQLLSGARIDRKAFAPSRELKSVAIPFSSLKHSK